MGDNLNKTEAVDIHSILKQVWGYDSFRPKQEEIINEALAGRDVLALMPTGGGKSICFQVPALAKEGICIVVSPLIALIKDQVQNLVKRGIPALSIYSGMGRGRIDAALDNAIYGNYKFLYVSPERLRTAIFRERVAKMNVNFLVVDEAHCISQWGYDFRPPYLKIAEIRELIGDVPVIALTATATKSVADDIMSKLDFAEPNLICSGFARENLAYVVRNTDDKLGNLLRICRGVPGTGIIYVRERKKCEEIANFLKVQGVDADFYHAGMSRELRTLKQDNWQSDKLRVIVSTNAFGMGIDKPDVRFVVHYDVPSAIESYFQEAGRAGRDGKKSYATLLWNSEDIKRLRQIHSVNFPPPDYIKDIYQKVFQYLGYAYEEGNGSVNKFDLADFARHFSLNAPTAYYAIKYIEQEGYWELTDELDNPAKIMFTVSRDSLYKVQVNNRTLDTFLKSLMRIYTGIFSKITPIDEEYVARITTDSPQGVKQKLITLSRMHVLKYIPRVKTPLMIMHYERLTESNFYLPDKRYNERKEVFAGRIEAMIEYLQEESLCRSRQLIKYFGQDDIPNCGICDVCLSNRKKVGGVDSLVRDAESAVREFVEQCDITGRKWNEKDICALNPNNPELYVEVMRRLIDDGDISQKFKSDL
ncbi:MAG: ATP-dependent DNA helicase RecQ [Bacteroidales bacterium]|nr:ATP-dependent DNA helicase RecQ [Bacteroidales bacterium]